MTFVLVWEYGSAPLVRRASFSQPLPLPPSVTRMARVRLHYPCMHCPVIQNAWALGLTVTFFHFFFYYDFALASETLCRCQTASLLFFFEFIIII